MPQIVTLPAFEDNYIWLIEDRLRRKAVVVDPGDSGPVIAHLEHERLDLDAILVTHKHDDHVGGIPALLARWPAARAYAPADESIAHRSHALRGGDRIELAAVGLDFEVIDVRGHTEGHIAYYSLAGRGMLFCGDALFGGGCGRVFTGNYAAQTEALARLAALPESTRVFCAHEYTTDNLGFAAWVEPDNPALARRIDRVRRLRERDEPSVPSTLAEELATNPFLRLGEPVVISAAEDWAGHRLADPVDIFTALRRWKDEDYD